MDDKQLQALANELAKISKPLKNLSRFRSPAQENPSVEAALSAELTHHLGHDKNQPKSNQLP